MRRTRRKRMRREHEEEELQEGFIKKHGVGIGEGE